MPDELELASAGTVELEGFFDARWTGDDCFALYLVRPVVREYLPHNLGGFLDMLEDAAASGVLAAGDNHWWDRSDEFNDLPALKRAFRYARTRFRKGLATELLYYRVVLEAVWIDEGDWEIAVLDFEGCAELRALLERNGWL